MLCYLQYIPLIADFGELGMRRFIRIWLAAVALIVSPPASAIELSKGCKEVYEKFENWNTYYKVFAYGFGSGGRTACATDIAESDALRKCNKLLDKVGGNCRVYAKSPVDGKLQIVWGDFGNSRISSTTELPNWVPKYSSKLSPIESPIKLNLIPGYSSICKLKKRTTAKGKSVEVTGEKKSSTKKSRFGTAITVRFRAIFGGKSISMLGWADVDVEGKLINNSLKIEGTALNESARNTLEKSFGKFVFFDAGYAGKTARQGFTLKNETHDLVLRNFPKIMESMSKVTVADYKFSQNFVGTFAVFESAMCPCQEKVKPPR